jgi:hypothetical protein
VWWFEPRWSYWPRAWASVQPLTTPRAWLRIAVVSTALGGLLMLACYWFLPGIPVPWEPGLQLPWREALLATLASAGLVGMVIASVLSVPPWWYISARRIESTKIPAIKPRQVIDLYVERGALPVLVARYLRPHGGEVERRIGVSAGVDLDQLEYVCAALLSRRAIVEEPGG